MVVAILPAAVVFKDAAADIAAALVCAELVKAACVELATVCARRVYDVLQLPL